MDFCKDEAPAATAQQKTFPAEEKPRPVLVNSEKNNAVPTNVKPRIREISSRYKSGITSTPRSPSPKASQTSPMSKTSAPQRPQSAERRRPSTPSSPSSRHSAPLSSSSPFSKTSRPSSPSSPSSTPFSKTSRPSSPSSSSRSSTPVRDSKVERVNSSRRSLVSRAPDGLWPSIRNLSTSFQSESSSNLSASFQSERSSALCSKSEKPVRNPSPDRTLKSSTNAASERKRTPLRGRNTSGQTENSRPVEDSHVRAIDQLRWPRMIGGKVSTNALSTKSMDLTDKMSRSGSLSISARGFSPTRRMSSTDAMNRGLRNSTNEVARPVSSRGSEKGARNVTSVPLERAPSNTRPSRSPSPLPSLVRPSSPNKASATLSRGMSSPSRTRPTTPSSPSSSASTRLGASSSIFNYIADVRKGKRSPSHMDDSHHLRLLYNRNLQWRFVNARADEQFSTQKIVAEEMLCNVWNITSELRDSVTVKTMDVQNLRREMKWKSIIKEQMAYLEDWSILGEESYDSLSGTIEALKANTLRLPVTGRARADVGAVKNAISSAVDVMQAMGSSICCLLSRVEGTNSVVSELSEIAATESIMLDECRESLAAVAAMQVQECSLRTHLIQLRQDLLVE
ncbi:uncharacterized protein A4U43_C01F220 [Asparagus officinalis]|uniref:AUGMIN subunit 8 n=1 Tax=Asparagus officinalis TaxID=4686 RepID=A0A5P1FQ67_ASPOF|nr:AUGMIN subunit 8-like [Asparagus officinalis]XP_020269757.1 AUGMIN subunit 8-like [Asparagus officinalis]ONK78851.1 uncharacterized protein A4U43_C01F220 [Asparagus officinalis]